ncbi:GyrI-like domain-containing protein [Solimicrobium silvestre]|uniref:AraC effector-binding domain-containing protein n=1 Tax=Solimicrobium silvestre TaxID=2099400 RepID=A0A2S9H0Y1_9BURK|nr:GyrI-like domain-containing protein [Solimicrobium silvestre]PRC93617.1 hypothetical protein S2091_1618 [Solimicrobium silvestre]
MKPLIKQVTEFRVAGLAVRTKNCDEFDSSRAKIPALWGTLFATDALNSIPHQPSEPAVFGVYSGYESDASGEYDLTVGALVSAAGHEFSHVAICDGDYLVFEARGAMPAALIQTWGQVWAYFEQHPEQARCYKTDFEQYLGEQAVDVFIGIKKSA